MSNKLVISIGSNSHDKAWQMKHGIEWLKSVLNDCRVSSIYTSPATNGKDEDYLNAVMSAKCRDSLDEITLKLKQYETVCGRTPVSKKEGVIPMDLDIVIWNDKIIREKDFSHEYFQIGWKEL